MRSTIAPDTPIKEVVGNLSIQNSNNPSPTIVIAGNPNCGKTSIFNALTGSRQHVANWPGVTVEKRYGSFKINQTKIQVVDLPGTYSLLSQSEDEQIAASFLVSPEVDVIVNVLDASNLERNLYLTTQLFEIKKPIIFVLNMIDDAERQGILIDIQKIQELLGGPTVATVGNHGNGIGTLKQAIFNIVHSSTSEALPACISYGNDIDGELAKIQDEIYNDCAISNQYPPRLLALGLLEQAGYTKDIIKSNCSAYTQQRDSAEFLEKHLGADAATLIAEHRYGFAHGLVKEALKQSYTTKQGRTAKIDHILTHKWLGIPIFIAIMLAVYSLTFLLGQYPKKWIATALETIRNMAIDNMPQGELTSLLTDGIIPGVGAIVTFVPIIMILMGCISFLEDTGYMSRAAFIMDRPMHFMGLHGKSFIPLIMGTGCNVPAVQATRAIESKSDRLITILISPLISCSARLQVYVLISGAFFDDNKAVWAVIALHIISFTITMATGKILRLTIFRDKTSPFVMELPPYRMPVLTSTVIHMWEKGRLFLTKSGTLILVGVILIWSLSHYPGIANKDYKSKHVADREVIYCQNLTPEKTKEKIDEINITFENHIMDTSLAAYIGRQLQPIMAPILDPDHKRPNAWKEGLALIAGFVAKETVISTLGVTNQTQTTKEPNNNDISPLQNAIRQNSGLTPLTAFAFMIFIMLYTPCLGMVSMIAKETNSFTWPIFSVVYSLILAWLMSWMTVFIGHICGAV
jgi:ferrous iron transport protein B